MIDIRKRALLVDKGTTKTIIHPNVVVRRPVPTPVWRLKTANGTPDNVRGMADSFYERRHRKDAS